MSNESFKKFQDNVQKVSNGVTDTIGSGISKIQSELPDLKAGFKKATNSLTGALRGEFPKLQSRLEALSGNFGFGKSISQAEVVIQDSEKDWRLRLSMPKSLADASKGPSDLLAPLTKTNGLVFPYTPTVLVSQSANYQSIHPVHTNYPYFSYQNSQVDQMTITGDFFVQNAQEARYWVACIHYLRSVTKMNYGTDGDAGQPPPVVRLDGYGDFVFNNVPVIINSFQFDMPKDVDYISTSVGKAEVAYDYDIGTSPTSWAPATSIITVAVTPQYSRTQQSQFSLNKFVKDGYMKDRNGFI